ncbi:hypothetical protein Y032_0063g3447 [Ancylostoma ceylanicum]|uniref:Peptidase M13 N-terminal domain-containing protein n=2 Tax=Ancylostoma ceylanicum TaxID=53326 RepID=A0A016U2X1_9BILA|nr:hypothetical protein Y032_0063g3447 [Ancylostoma ceylanicum]
MLLSAMLLSAMYIPALARHVDPCDDFYEFACGNYGLNRNLPASKPLRHTISDVQSRLNKQVKSILQMPILDTESKWDRLAKGYYQKCLDEDELERTGLTAIKEIVDWVGGWPTLQGHHWKEWNYSWEEQLALVMNRTGVNAVILELAVTHDPANSSNSVIELDQPKWGVGSRWPYLMGPDDPMLKNYTHLMTLTAVALGAEQKLAEREMYEAMELELKLVNFSADDMVRRDPDRGNNRFQLWQLKSHFPLGIYICYLSMHHSLANFYWIEVYTSAHVFPFPLRVLRNIQCSVVAFRHTSLGLPTVNMLTPVLAMDKLVCGVNTFSLGNLNDACGP